MTNRMLVELNCSFTFYKILLHIFFLNQFTSALTWLHIILQQFHTNGEVKVEQATRAESRSWIRWAWDLPDSTVCKRICSVVGRVRVTRDKLGIAVGYEWGLVLQVMTGLKLESHPAVSSALSAVGGHLQALMLTGDFGRKQVLGILVGIFF